MTSFLPPSPPVKSPPVSRIYRENPLIYTPTANVILDHSFRSGAPSTDIDSSLSGIGGGIYSGGSSGLGLGEGEMMSGGGASDEDLLRKRYQNLRYREAMAMEEGRKKRRRDRKQGLGRGGGGGGGIGIDNDNEDEDDENDEDEESEEKGDFMSLSIGGRDGASSSKRRSFGLDRRGRGGDGEDRFAGSLQRVGGKVKRKKRKKSKSKSKGKGKGKGKKKMEWRSEENLRMLMMMRASESERVMTRRKILHGGDGGDGGGSGASQPGNGGGEMERGGFEGKERTSMGHIRLK